MYPTNCRYTKDHEWIREDNGVYTVGITAFAAEQLGDVTYVELPAVGRRFGQGAAAASVESVKAASDVYAPVGGTVCATNTALENAPELVNQGPYDQGWFFKLDGVNPAEVNGLMDAAAYEAMIRAEQE